MEHSIIYPFYNDVKDVRDFYEMEPYVYSFLYRIRDGGSSIGFDESHGIEYPFRVIVRGRSLDTATHYLVVLTDELKKEHIYTVEEMTKLPTHDKVLTPSYTMIPTYVEKQHGNLYRFVVDIAESMRRNVRKTERQKYEEIDAFISQNDAETSNHHT